MTDILAKLTTLPAKDENGLLPCWCGRRIRLTVCLAGRRRRWVKLHNSSHTMTVWSSPQFQPMALARTREA